MEHDEALARMREIQRIMERTTLYTLLPGTPAVIGGILALIGCAISYAMIHSLDFARAFSLPLQAQIGFCIMWTVIGVAAVAQEIALTARAAQRQGIPPMGRPWRFAGLSLTPSVFVAVVLTIKLLMDGDIQYIVPVWMMCYGTGVYAAGLFSLRMPRLLGLAFIAMGTVGLLVFPQYGLLLAALSFGLLHIIFGLVVINKAGRGNRK